VRKTPFSYWRRGYRILVFAGARAWQHAQRFIEAGGVVKARERTTLASPPGESPDSMRWPVRHRMVWIVDTGGADVEGLCTALIRDGAVDVTLYRIGYEPAWSWELSLSQLAPRFDTAVIAAVHQAERGVMIDLLVRSARGAGGERVRVLIQEFAADGNQTAQLALGRLEDGRWR
jgi:hypothetical protein